MSYIDYFIAWFVTFCVIASVTWILQEERLSVRQVFYSAIWPYWLCWIVVQYIYGLGVLFVERKR